jgi:Prenyltransferase and squalene oxidase repeat
VMAWRTLRAADISEARWALDRANRWLARVSCSNTPNAAALLLWSSMSGNDTAALQHDRALAFLRRIQTSEGGWGPYAATPAEVFDTALALLALARHPVRPGAGEMIARGRRFLAAQQLPDGSWPATTRPPGGVSYAQQMSTTGWATLALLETR